MPCNSVQDAAQHKTGQVCRLPIDQESIEGGGGACSELPLSPRVVGVGNTSLVVTACVCTCREGNRCNVGDWRCALGEEARRRQLVQCRRPTASLGGPSLPWLSRTSFRTLALSRPHRGSFGQGAWCILMPPPHVDFPLLDVRPNRVVPPVASSLPLGNARQRRPCSRDGEPGQRHIY